MVATKYGNYYSLALVVWCITLKMKMFMEISKDNELFDFSNFPAES